MTDQQQPASQAQRDYWDSMKGKRGSETPRWKGELAGKRSKHQWLDAHFGKPDICERLGCQGKSNLFEWCLKPGRKYTHNREDYLRLCRSCHRKIDKIVPPSRKGTKSSLETIIKLREVSSRRSRIGGMYV
jgi:hypothetical protein